MASTRALLGLTQQRLASWLGVTRETLAQVESKGRSLPHDHWLPDGRLMLAVRGKVLRPDGTSYPGPPPLPPPPMPRKPLEDRLRYCRHHANRLRYELEALRRQAAPYLARLAALPALRAYEGPVANPAHEENWLALLEGEALQALEQVCGPGAQALLEARIAGLEREAEVLAERLAALPPDPDPAPAPQITE